VPNPNVAAAVVIGIEPNWTKSHCRGDRQEWQAGRGTSIERFGDLKTLAAAARVAQHMLQDASELHGSL